MADMEGQSRSSAGVSQLESKIQDLEERLHNEERYSTSVGEYAAVDLHFGSRFPPSLSDI